MMTVAMEFNSVPAAHTARPLLSSFSVPFTSLATLDGSAKASILPHSIDPIPHTNRALDERYASLLTFDKREAAELEFSSQSHLIILLQDGITGGCEWNNGNQTGKLSSVAPNTILFNPARAYLRIRKRTSQPCRILLLSIDPAVVNLLGADDINVADLQFCQQIGIEDRGIRLTLAAIAQEIEAPGLNSRLYIDSLLVLLLTLLMRCASNFAAPRQPAYVKGGLQNWQLKRALELLETEGTKTPSLADLAEPLRLHPTYFCRAFKQSIGLSPHRYFLEHRVNRAKEMMKDPKRTLTEIALDCGFSSSSQFSVVFKRITGMPPRGYRLSL
jgi:AraC family transcriptional regulator